MPRPFSGSMATPRGLLLLIALLMLYVYAYACTQSIRAHAPTHLLTYILICLPTSMHACYMYTHSQPVCMHKLVAAGSANGRDGGPAAAARIPRGVTAGVANSALRRTLRLRGGATRTKPVSHQRTQEEDTAREVAQAMQLLEKVLLCLRVCACACACTCVCARARACACARASL